MPSHSILGTGPPRRYLSLKPNGLPPWERDSYSSASLGTRDEHTGESHRSAGGVGRDLGYPPRPVLGSVADLDKLLERCDFGTNKVSV